MEQTAFSRLHPLTSFLYFIGVLYLTMVLQHPVYLATGLFVSYLVLRMYTKLTRQMIISFIVLLSFMVILNPIFVRNGLTNIFSIFNYPISLEGIVYGLKSGFIIIITLVTFTTFNHVITSNKLLFLFSKILPRGAMLLALALRFLPLFKYRIQQIDEIQTTKGHSLRTGSLKKRAKAGMMYLQVLLSFSLEEALQTADSMKARGYTGKHTHRTSYQYFHFSKKDSLTLAILVFFVIVVVFGKYNGFGNFIYFPRIGTLMLKPEDLVFLSAYLIFISFPVLIEGGSRIKWHLLHLKT